MHVPQCNGEEICNELISLVMISICKKGSFPLISEEMSLARSYCVQLIVLIYSLNVYTEGL